ncbi:methyltransferase domain-containing protein [Agromyces sp. CFH 90414]|uniref:Methyltransferase domain-containing protein n=1 Tax=Agromyces agglutinans TaxID=2662258 RepID=A0A6I2FC45_9MICO|nr:class I SAM-dependent methyltransferase [Agromyces agglutinans]MRG61694.1 methyltransferase domain-containing protein [Agromyces agglutinans]
MSDTLIHTEPEPSALRDAEEAEAARIGEFAEQLVGMLGAATTLLTIELGRRFGLYRALHERGPLNPVELAEATGIAPRYAREWLEQQAAAGILHAETAAPAADARPFTLPGHHVPGLVEELHPGHAAPAASVLAGVALAFPAVVADFPHGRGVAFDAYGAELRHGLGALNRPGFHHAMRDWVGALPDRAAALDRGGVVLDAGCGTGWSSVALAAAFPRARVVGVDLDEASIDEARGHAAVAGVADRVRFLVGDAGETATVRAAAEAVDAPAGFDLVTVFEALHDMGRPAAALAAFREALADGGALLVADERVGEAFQADADPVERMLYAMSVLHCLPATTAESAADANGTVLRAPTLRRWASEAGYDGVEVLGIENPFWRFYRIG